ncbi:MAG: TIGR00730 family Rossman fold protein [Lentisphaerales bacterium]|nr:TIGR00730 family Rossman fold protein [Lentisphaerales bacterium]
MSGQNKAHGEKAPRAYENQNFISSPDGRLIRIIAEMQEPQHRFRRERIRDSIVFFGSARTPAPEDALAQLEKAKKSKDEKKIKAAEMDLEMAQYYGQARELARLLTEWSIDNHYGYYVCSGGGPGIMEAANRGAKDVEDGRSIGLNITLPFEQYPNAYITDELNFEFNYFFIRKFWFTYLAKAIVVFPGGFGTFDEFFEILTLVQTKKTAKIMLIVLFGSDFWNDVINFDGLVRRGVISEEDLELFKFADTAEDAFKYITQELERLRKLFPLYHPH